MTAKTWEVGFKDRGMGRGDYGVIDGQGNLVAAIKTGQWVDAKMMAMAHKLREGVMQAVQTARLPDNVRRNLEALLDETEFSKAGEPDAQEPPGIGSMHGRVCNCGNAELFECSCNWTEKHPGNNQYHCSHCGIYDAAKPKCNRCQMSEGQEDLEE